ncbi:MAG: hypothetical protein OXC31_02455 [Spirochaetaceae bacterium]|nr:hypothetical protein [Spirochaetaceae bacterium]
MSETLYNGIVLPEPWPPRHVDPSSREPLPVPYLERPPEVIPIDLGRQLFVDDFLISETTLERRFGRPQVHPSSPVLVPATPQELDGGQCPTAAPFNDGLWYDPAGGLCVVVGDELRFYFAGFSGESPILEPGKEGDRGINRYRMYAGASTGLATLRRDGFAAMATEDEPGSLVTRPLSFSGAHLFVNAACADGELRVEVLDERGGVVPGYTAAACVALAGDSTRHRMAWRGDASLARLAGLPVRFRFHLRRGALYAFWVSRSPRGESSGYVAAGGPGFAGPTDARSD